MSIKGKCAMAAMIMTILLNSTRLDAKQIINGSFEADGSIADINTIEPNGWTDVNMPSSSFGGWIASDWSTDRFYILTLHAFWYSEFLAGDMVSISQYVDLSDANEIVFDAKLETIPSGSWDANEMSVLIFLDGEVQWQMAANGNYLNQVIPVEGITGIHKLTIGLRSNMSDEFAYTWYYPHFDNFRFNLKCGGLGFDIGDLNGDCAVNGQDYAILAEMWLQEVESGNMRNLFKGDDAGIINFCDFAVYAKTWTPAIKDLKNLADNWLYEVDANDPNNMSSEDDLGVINFDDLAILQEHWLSR